MHVLPDPGSSQEQNQRNKKRTASMSALCKAQWSEDKYPSLVPQATGLKCLGVDKPTSEASVHSLGGLNTNKGTLLTRHCTTVI